METITKTIYKANDGKEFDTEQECLEYENNSLETKFENWYMGGYSSNELIVTVQTAKSDDYTTEKVMSHEIFHWLTKHKEEIAKFLFPSDFNLIQEIKKLIDQEPFDICDSNLMENFIDDLEKLISQYEKN